ncbi:MAG TPA: sialidase family protein [Terriglobales bacterium]|nr:sialidase family protein [Terriglobales bacterium]
MSNIQVTNDPNPSNARSESAILINPNNPLQIVASSKKFRNLHTYDFTLATAYSGDGGNSWNDSADFTLPTGTTVMTDPTLAWDDAGNVFFVGLVGNNPPTFNTVGMVVYKSTDGGKTWGAPNVIHTSVGDDKQWAAGDTNPASAFHGRIYAVWDDGSQMRFARTLDGGASWVGTAGNSVAATSLAPDSFSPEINVAANGDIYIVWIAGSTIKMLVSTDGGDSFHTVTPPATGVTTLSASLSNVHGWPVFPGGNFRVLTVPTACVIGETVAVAWDDFREGVSRIYFALSTDGGMSWNTGTSGHALLTGALPSNFQHFFPQIIANPGGTIGCAFYEFGPKPSTDLIDVLFAQSLDGGATFQVFMVTDQPWDPTVDAPWAHHGDATPIDSSVTFIGDYFGIDASNEGFYPLWTDTRTGVQELFTDIVPERRCQFLIERSELGQDEIDARRMQPHNSPGGLPVPLAFRVLVDGFTAAEIGVTGSNSTLNVLSPAGMIVTCTGNSSATGNYGPEVQRFTFFYNIDFPDNSAFNFATQTKNVTLDVALNATVHGRAASLTAEGQIELIKQPNPFILHGDPAWLSIDLRTFVVRSGDSLFGVNPMGNDASDAPRFISDVIAALTSGQGQAGGQSFEDPNVLSPDEEKSELYIQPKDNNGHKVFNFALAKVHYIGLIGAANVRVFFRLFRTQVTYVPFDYPPGGRYRRALSNPAGQPIPLPGIEGGEFVTMPFFATPRVDSTVVSMNQQTDGANIHNITAHSDGSEVDAYFGCWLDTNQPFKADGVTPNNVIPISSPGSNVDGPYTDPGNPPVTIQQAILRNSHQCLIAEVAFDPDAIPPGKDPSNWDKLAQRNIIWSDVGSAEAVSTFEFRPTRIGLPIGQVPDELMIDWGKVPEGAPASIYIPSVKAADVIAMADRMYASHRLVRVDDHTLRCPTGGTTYIPLPPGAPINYPGLLSIEIPEGLPKGRAFTAVIYQVTNAIGWATKPVPVVTARRKQRSAAQSARHPIEWRRVIGAFQITIPVKNKADILLKEERRLSVLRWVGEAIPHHSRWYPVFQRYLEKLGGRVKTFGGDPGSIVPSPTGSGVPKPGHHPHHHGHEEHGRCYTGKIAGLIFDRFGDFEGFLLDTEDGDRKFFSREKEVAELAERAWHERLRITVWTDRAETHRPVSIVIRQPPAPFRI